MSRRQSCCLFVCLYCNQPVPVAVCCHIYVPTEALPPVASKTCTSARCWGFFFSFFFFSPLTSHVPPVSPHVTARVCVSSFVSNRWVGALPRAPSVWRWCFVLADQCDASPSLRVSGGRMDLVDAALVLMLLVSLVYICISRCGSVAHQGLEVTVRGSVWDGVRDGVYGLGMRAVKPLGSLDALDVLVLALSGRRLQLCGKEECVTGGIG